MAETEMCAKLTRNASESARGEGGGGNVGAGNSKALEELVTYYFVQDSSDEEEFSTDEDSESETEPALRSLRQTESGPRGNDYISRQS